MRSNQAVLPSTWADTQLVELTVDRGFHPPTIHVRAGSPIRLVVWRLDPSECAARVVFSSPRIERRLALTTPTTIDLPAQAAGDVRFTCGMGRYTGRIQVHPAGTSIISRSRERLRALTGLSARSTADGARR